jgi:integrase
MSKRRRRIPKYRHYKPKNLGVVRIDGRDHYLGRYDSPESWGRYHQLIADLLSAGPNRVPKTTPSLTPSEVSVNQLVLTYWRFAESYYVKDGQLTDETYGIRAAVRPIRKAYGHTPAGDFSPLMLKAVRGSMLDAGLSRGVINQHIGRIKRMFKWGVENELIPVSVYQALATVAGLKKGRCRAREPEAVRPVAEADIQAILPAVSDVLRSMVQFQRLTGCRPGEVCCLRPCDLDTHSDVWCYVPESHKAEHHERERRIYIGPAAQDVVRPFLNRPDDAYCFSPKESISFDQSQVKSIRTMSDRARRPRASRRGDRYTTDSYRRAIGRACKRIGIAPWSPNRLRHSCATELRRRYGLEAAQTVLGHSKADVTQVYAERDFGAAEQIMREAG